MATVPAAPPTTMPAIAPVERPREEVSGEAAEVGVVLVVVELAVAVDVPLPGGEVFGVPDEGEVPVDVWTPAVPGAKYLVVVAEGRKPACQLMDWLVPIGSLATAARVARAVKAMGLLASGVGQ